MNDGKSVNSMQDLAEIRRENAPLSRIGLEVNFCEEDSTVVRHVREVNFV